MAKHLDVDAAIESLFALPSDSDSNSVSEECSFPSSNSAQLEVCGYGRKTWRRWRKRSNSAGNTDSLCSVSDSDGDDLAGDWDSALSISDDYFEEDETFAHVKDEDRQGPE